MTRSVALALLILVALGAAPARSFADPAGRPITDLVPADNLVVYMAKPYGAGAVEPTTQPGTPPPVSDASIATILSTLNAVGLIPDEGQVFADIAAALPLLGRFEHALILLDVSSRIVGDAGGRPKARTGVSLRLKTLQAAVVFRTDGRERLVLEQLNRIAGRYTNTNQASLSEARTADHPYHRLVDDRLPGWAVWEWGRLDQFFVVSFGAGAFERVAAAYDGKRPALSHDLWFRSAQKKTRSDRALVQWYIALKRLEERIGSAADAARERQRKVIADLNAVGMTHDLWTVGLEGRALTWYRCYQRDGKDYPREYSDPAAHPPRFRNIIPDQARHFAIIRVPTSWLVDNLPRAWVDAQSQRNVRKWTRIWQSLEEQCGIDLSANLIKPLGKHIVIFDYPPHPLRIPFALTIAIEIRDRQAMTTATNALLAAWSQYLDERAKRKGTRLVRVKVRKAPDNVWYLQAGILGPALKVIDGYVVISWSPAALRDALKFIEPRAAASTRPPSPSP